MFIETVANQAYAFALTWTAELRRPAAAAIRKRYAAADKSRRTPYYYCVLTAKAEHGRYVYGGGLATGHKQRKLYSYAATLAANGVDGIYVVRVDKNHLWFCVVRDGLVTPDTDAIGADAEVIGKVESFRSLFGFAQDAVFVGEDVVLPGGGRAFDPTEIAAHSKRPVQLKRAAARMNLIPVALVAAAVIIAIVGYKIHVAHVASQKHLLTTAQQRQQAIAAYQSAVTGALKSYPLEPDWAASAWAKVAARAPAFLAGWVLKDVDCTLSGCDATYQLARAPAYAIQPFVERFGQSAVAVAPSGTSLKLHLPMHYSGGGNTLEYLHHPPRDGLPTLDWLGLVKLHVTGITSKPQLLAVDLGRQHRSAQLGLADVATETVKLQGRGSPAAALAGAAHWGRVGRLRVTGFTVTTNLEDGNASLWTITLLGISG